MSSSQLNEEPRQWFNEKKRSFSFDYGNLPDFSKAISLCESAELFFIPFAERKKMTSIKSFDKCCKQLSSIIKKVALENNVEKIAELDCHLVGLSSFLELCMQNGSLNVQQSALNNYSKQIDCLKQIKRHCECHKTYESYLPVIYDSVPGVDYNFSQGLPLDAIHRSINSCVASFRNMNFANFVSKDFVDLLNNRSLALKRAKALHSLQQIAYMDRYARDFPLDSQSIVYLDKRESVVKSIDSALAKTALELSENKSKSQENIQQTQEQEPASNKKAKSSPDLER